MHLSNEEYNRLEQIQTRIMFDEETPADVDEFLNLIVKSGNESEMMGYMHTIEVNSIEEIQQHLSKNREDKNVKTGLAIAGGAILLALFLSK